MSREIIPPEDRIPSRTYRRKIQEGQDFFKLTRIDLLEENYENIDFSKFPTVEIKEKKETTQDYEPKEVKNKLTKIVLQKPKVNTNAFLITLYLDYGYLKDNLVKKVVNINQRNPQNSYPTGKCLIHLYNSNDKKIAQIPMVHSSNFVNHPITKAPQLFLGLLENLEPNKLYQYRIDCLDEENQLVANSELIRFEATHKGVDQPLFFLTASDLHGGAGATFKRGKVWWFRQKNNERLLQLMEKIKETENEYTFGNGYDFLSTSGDNVENGSYHEYWADFYECCSKNISRFPIFPTIGNHDYLAGGIRRGTYLTAWKKTQKNFHTFFQIPKDHSHGAYYSHKEGNLLLIHLDSMGLNWGNENIKCQSRQWYWLKNELEQWRKRQKQDENEPDFCIVFLHSAILTIGYFGRTRGNSSDKIAQTSLTPLLHHFDVNATIFGHDHMYQRSEIADTTYICAGLSGKTPINYFDYLRNKVNYNIKCDEEGDKARGFGVVYTPPKQKYTNSREFEATLKHITNVILNGKITKYYNFKESEKAELEEVRSSRERRKEFISTRIIAKLKNHIWWRFYNLDGQLVDSAFLKSTQGDYEDEIGQCPAKHIR